MRSTKHIANQRCIDYFCRVIAIFCGAKSRLSRQWSKDITTSLCIYHVTHINFQIILFQLETEMQQDGNQFRIIYIKYPSCKACKASSKNLPVSSRLYATMVYLWSASAGTELVIGALQVSWPSTNQSAFIIVQKSTKLGISNILQLMTSSFHGSQIASAPRPLTTVTPAFGEPDLEVGLVAPGFWTRRRMTSTSTNYINRFEPWRTIWRTVG